jgi:RNA polymerase sigma factor (sigma-70 family)
MDPETLYQNHLDDLTRMAMSVCRRYGFTDEDAEDFASDVRLKLQENDYGIVRKFKGRSAFNTYLNVVVANLFRDHRDKRWGKWRASAEARRLGEVAVQLETLVYRDGHTFESACKVLEQRSRGTTMAELRRLYAKLPRRTRRRIAGEPELAGLAGDDEADRSLLNNERDERLRAAQEALRRALDTLDDEDRLIIKMLYFEGYTVAEIARTLHIEQKPLYPRIKRLLHRLQERLLAEGIRSDLMDFLQPN